MDSENSSPFTMPVAPMYGGNGGFGSGFGGDWGWIILLLLVCGGGWGNGFGGFGGFGGGLGIDFPWLMNGQNGINNNVNDGFRDQMTHDAITSIGDKVTSGFGDVQTALCSGFAGTTAAVTGAQNAIAQQLYTNQIADLERSFAAQTASTQGLTAIQSQLAQCCCENRASTADLKYTVATEACADRSAISDGIRDVIANNTAQTQAILDKLCALELDGYKRENDHLRTQLNMANLAASQTAQNAFIAQGFSDEVDALYNRLNSCPVPTTPVYGRTPIFTCGNSGCGCGNGFMN
jgi:hypothetical protein